MDYIKISLKSDLDQAGADFKKTIEDMFQSMNPMFSLSERTWKPLMDIYETPEEIIVMAAIAGIKKGDLEVEINTRAVRIRGRRSFMLPGEKTKFCLAEIQYGTFERILFLPAQIVSETATATYTNGFLQIRMAKKPIDKPRKIPIEDETGDL